MKVTVIDYGLSNLLSVERALTHLGAQVEITGEAEQIRRAEALVLPGVGAFRDGMAGLEKLGLIPVLREKCAEGTPLLGICLGMQMLFEESEEFGLHQGLHFLNPVEDMLVGRHARTPLLSAMGVSKKFPGKMQDIR